MTAVLPKLDITQVQTTPAAGTPVAPGARVTYRITISPDATATAGAANVDLAVALGTGLTLDPASVTVADPSGGTDTITPGAGGTGFDVAFGNTIAANAQPITITYRDSQRGSRAELDRQADRRRDLRQRKPGRAGLRDQQR